MGLAAMCRSSLWFLLCFLPHPVATQRVFGLLEADLGYVIYPVPEGEGGKRSTQPSGALQPRTRRAPWLVFDCSLCSIPGTVGTILDPS